MTLAGYCSFLGLKYIDLQIVILALLCDSCTCAFSRSSWFLPRIHTSDRSEKRPRHVEPQCDLSGSAAFQDFFLMLTFHMPEESEGYKRSRCADDNQIEGKEREVG